MVEREVLFEAPIDVVFGVITDLENYPKFLTTTKEVKTTVVAGALEADFKVSVIKDIEYRLRFTLKAPSEVRWEMLSGQMMKKNSGAWYLESLGANQTRGRYCVDVEFGWMVPQVVVNTLTEVQLPQLLAAFKKRIEEVYGSQKSTAKPT